MERRTWKPEGTKSFKLIDSEPKFIFRGKQFFSFYLKDRRRLKFSNELKVLSITLIKNSNEVIYCSLKYEFKLGAEKVKRKRMQYRNNIKQGFVKYMIPLFKNNVSIEPVK